MFFLTKTESILPLMESGLAVTSNLLYNVYLKEFNAFKLLFLSLFFMVLRMIFKAGFSVAIKTTSCKFSELGSKNIAMCFF